MSQGMRTGRLNVMDPRRATCDSRCQSGISLDGERLDEIWEENQNRKVTIQG